LYYCLKGVIHQTTAPGKVVVIVHNSEDESLEIAKRVARTTKIPLKVVDFKGEQGVEYARLESLKHIEDSFSTVLCLDGDSIPAENWVEVMSQHLKSEKVSLLGSFVKFKGPVICRILNIINTFYVPNTGIDSIQWIWGPSFGFQRRDIGLIRDFLEKGISLKSTLGLNSSMEDYIRACLFFKEKLSTIYSNKESLKVVKNTYVKTYVKEKDNLGVLKRTRKNLDDKKKLDLHFFNTKI